MSGKPNPTKICLVGAGRMGTRWAKIISENSNTELVCVVDIDKNSGEDLANKYNAKFVSSQSDNIFGACDIDGVVIVTPHSYLFDYTKKALLSNKHVLTEKPGSCNSAQMKELVHIANEKNLRFMIGYNYRFFDAISRAKKVLDSQDIGKLCFMRIRHGHAGRSNYDKEWRMNKEISGGGALMDQGVHVIDLANWFLDNSDLYGVSSSMNSIYWNTEVEESAFLLLKNNNQQIASLNVSIIQWKPIFFLEIYGTKGYCIVNGAGRKYGGKELLTVGLRGESGEVSEETIECDSNADNSLLRELDEFVTSIEKERDPSPCGKDGLAVLNIVESAYKKTDESQI